MTDFDYRLSVELRDEIEPPNPMADVRQGAAGTWWCTLRGRLGSSLVPDAIRILGDRGARLADEGRWNLDTTCEFDDEPAAFRLVDACPDSIGPHRLLNPPEEFDPAAPHADQRRARLLDGVPPNVQRKPRGEFGFVHTQPIAHRTVARRLEEFGARVGPELLVRGEPAGWFVVELDRDVQVIDLDLCSRQWPCPYTEVPHPMRAAIGPIVAATEAPDEFGWRYESTGWGCGDYERRTVIDVAAHDFLLHRGRKRAGDFAVVPIHPHDGEAATLLREFTTLIQEHLTP